MDAVTHDDIRTERTIYRSLLHFTGISAESFHGGWLNITWNLEVSQAAGAEVRCELNARGYCPVAFLSLKQNWFDRVHGLRLDQLPRMRVGGDDLWFDPVFILDADQRYLADDNETWHCAATWTTGGRTIKKGHLAWTYPVAGSFEVEMWAVSAREDLAIKRCQKRVEELRQHEARQREIEMEEQLEEERIAIAQDADLIASIVI
jgi:hypothetical protein